MPEHLFVYGTLRRDTGNWRGALMKPLRRTGEGTIAADLYDVGLYPAAVPSEKGRVTGELFEMEDAEATLRELDTVEMCSGPSPAKADLFRRGRASVTVPGGREITAWVYFWNGPLEGLTPIPSGDYVRYLREKSD